HALDPGFAQPADGGAVRAVDLDGEQIIAADPHAPGAVKLAHGAIIEHEYGIGRIVRGSLVRLTVLGNALRDIGVAVGNQALDITEQVADDILPMAEHIDHDAAPVGQSVIPTRALGRLVVDVTGEDPVTELAAD